MDATSSFFIEFNDVETTTGGWYLQDSVRADLGDSQSQLASGLATSWIRSYFFDVAYVSTNMMIKNNGGKSGTVLAYPGAKGSKCKDTKNDVDARFYYDSRSHVLRVEFAIRVQIGAIAAATNGRLSNADSIQAAMTKLAVSPGMLKNIAQKYCIGASYFTDAVCKMQAPSYSVRGSAIEAAMESETGLEVAAADRKLTETESEGEGDGEDVSRKLPKLTIKPKPGKVVTVKASGAMGKALTTVGN